MKKLVLSLLLVLGCVSFAMAQKKNDYHKIEVSGGYSIMRADGILGDGDLFSDNINQPLTANQDVSATSLFPTLTTFFVTTPLSSSGKRHHPGLQGFNGSATYNFSKHLGVKFEMSGNYRSNGVSGQLFVSTIFCSPNPSRICNAITNQPPLPAGTFPARVTNTSGGGGTKQTNYNYLGGL